MIQLSPKILFQQNKDSSKAWTAIVHSNHFQSGLSASLAEFSRSSHTTRERLEGVNHFIETMLNLCEAPSRPQRLPAKTLDHQAAEIVEAVEHQD